VDCCRYFAYIVVHLLNGVGKDIIFSEGFRSDLCAYFSDEPLRSELEAIIEGDFMTKNEEEIQSTGYAVYSLEAALWSFYHTDTFEEAILKSVNLGDDADTVAAITGQLAGAYCGIDGIPEKWLSGLSKVKDIGLTIEKLI
jgi:ADP-ribosyl-[dinitrogen reductase] hydrolase